MIDSKGKRAILSRLRRDTNGAVVGAMEARGIFYRLSYGVSIPTIKEVAMQYGKNHDLALELYSSQIRELMLAALFIDSPKLVTVDQMNDWATKFTNPEIAENAVSTLFYAVDGALEVAHEWIGSKDRFIIYAGLMLGAKILRVDIAAREQAASQNRDPEEAGSGEQAQKAQSAALGQGDVERLIVATDRLVKSIDSQHHYQTQLSQDELARQTHTDESSDPKPALVSLLSHGTISLLVSCARFSNDTKERVTELARLYSKSKDKYTKHTGQELEWQIV